MKDAVDVFDRLRGKTLGMLFGGPQKLDIGRLNGRSVQGVQTYSTQKGFDMQPDVGLVDIKGARLDIQQVSIHPSVQPLAKGLLVRLNIGAAINRCGSGF